MLNSNFCTFLGMQLGDFFITVKSMRKRAIYCIASGLASGLLGGLLCLFQFDGGLLPVNKNMWTLSFVLISVGLGQIVFVFVFLFEKWKLWANGWPVYYFGLNPILVYVGHEVLYGRWPFGFKNSGSHMMMVLSNLLTVALWNVIAYLCFKWNFFLKL